MPDEGTFNEQAPKWVNGKHLKRNNVKVKMCSELIGDNKKITKVIF